MGRRRPTHPSLGHRGGRPGSFCGENQERRRRDPVEARRGGVEIPRARRHAGRDRGTRPLRETEAEGVIAAAFFLFSRERLASEGTFGSAIAVSCAPNGGALIKYRFRRWEIAKRPHRNRVDWITLPA